MTEGIVIGRQNAFPRTYFHFCLLKNGTKKSEAISTSLFILRIKANSDS